jgi:hypothetical protein
LLSPTGLSVNSNQWITLSGSVHPNAQGEYGQGKADTSLELTSVMLVFKPSPQQQLELGQLLADPTLATAEKGKIIFEAVVNNFVKFAGSSRSVPWERGWTIISIKVGQARRPGWLTRPAIVLFPTHNRDSMP